MYTARRRPERGALGSKAQKALGEIGLESNSRWNVFRPPIRQDYGETSNQETGQDWIGPKGISKQGPERALRNGNPVLKESLIYLRRFSGTLAG